MRWRDLLAQHRPDEAAIEETYVNRNGTATLKLGYARGVALLAPALAGVPVTEYAAKSVKLAVVGTGGAEKAQVQMMVRRLLPGAAIRRADAADALAVAICHAHHRASRMVWNRAHEDRVIAQLTGRVEALEEGRCIIDVNGVGYLVHASTRTLAALPGTSRSRTAAGGDARARGRDLAVRLCRLGRARLVPPADDGAGCRRQGRAVRAVCAVASRSDRCHCVGRPGQPDAGARRGCAAGGAPADRTT